VHSAIFLTALFAFLIIIVLRFTLYCCFRELHQFCCKKIKSYLRPEEIQSDNVYRELSLKHLGQEFDKTKEEIELIDKKALAQLKDRLLKKKIAMDNEMRRRIVQGKADMEIGIDKWSESEMRTKIEEMLKESSKAGNTEVSGKMVSKIYSYDFADNERYMDLKKIVVAS